MQRIAAVGAVVTSDKVPTTVLHAHNSSYVQSAYLVGVQVSYCANLKTIGVFLTVCPWDSSYLVLPELVPYRGVEGGGVSHIIDGSH